MARLLLCSLWFFCASALAAEETTDAPLHFCNSHWPPYSYGDANGRAVGGYAVDFMKEIFARTGRPVRLSILPWLRCLKMAERGDVDGIMLLTASEERKQFLIMTDPLLSDANVFWYRRDNPGAQERLAFEELRGLRIGVVAGFNYGEAFNRAVTEYGLILDEAPSILSNFRRLDRNWIDVFPVNRLAADYALHNHSSLRSRFIAFNGPFEAVGFRLGLAKKGRAAGLIAPINEAINSMREDGSVERILRQVPFEYR